MKEKQKDSVQAWLPFETVLENGIIKIKEKTYIKIIKVIPINFNLKSEIEKEAILNSYKIFLKTCNFDIQILIKSNKEDLSKHISKIKIKNKNETKNIYEISEKYIQYIEKTNKEKKSSSKLFYILINNSEQIENNLENNIIQELNEKYYKIKECLSRCGNIVTQFEEKKEVIEILYSFLNIKNN